MTAERYFVYAMVSDNLNTIYWTRDRPGENLSLQYSDTVPDTVITMNVCMKMDQSPYGRIMDACVV